jgi:hypothetical protein
MTMETQRGTTGSPGDRSPTGELRVVYIGGYGRSGSTLLSRMLAEVKGVVNIGELRYIAQVGGIENRLCGCGERFRDCAFWSAVGTEAFGGWDNVDFQALLQRRALVDRPWRVPHLMAPRAGRRFTADVESHVSDLARLYRAVSAVSGASVIVDSSKAPSYALLLSRMPRTRVSLVHLVRDSRGTVFSWQKRIVRPDRPEIHSYMLRYPTMGAALRYTGYNLQMHMLRWTDLPYLWMRYEDVVRDPRRHLERILGFADVPVDDSTLEFLHDGQVKLGLSHTVLGNPMRMSDGWIDLRLDEEWTSKMAKGQRLAVSAVTAPLLVRYGYPLRYRER